MSNQSARSQGASFMERVMGIGEIERRAIGLEPRLLGELGFQFVALLFCPPVLGYAIFKVAIGLVGLSVLSGLAMATLVSFGLFVLDRHYLIQARGDSSARTRRAIYKIRAISVTLIGLSFILMAGDTFRKEIDHVLDEARLARRQELEQTQRFKLALKEAHEAMKLATDAAKRAEELQVLIARLRTERAVALEEQANQCEGNATPKGEIARGGCGPKARGAAAAATRLGLQLEAAEQDLARLGKVGQRVLAARTRLEKIDSRLDAEVVRSVGTAPQKVNALIVMLQDSWSARLVVGFWFLLAMVPDMLMFVAQGRMFNHELFVNMRQLQNEAVIARLAKLRRALRQEQADSLAPMDIRVKPVDQVKDTSLEAQAAPDETK